MFLQRSQAHPELKEDISHYRRMHDSSPHKSYEMLRGYVDTMLEGRRITMVRADQLNALNGRNAPGISAPALTGKVAKKAAAAADETAASVRAAPATKAETKKQTACYRFPIGVCPKTAYGHCKDAEALLRTRSPSAGKGKDKGKGKGAREHSPAGASERGRSPGPRTDAERKLIQCRFPVHPKTAI